MHLFVDSLHQLIYSPTEMLVETALSGLMTHCTPLAAIARLDLPDRSSHEKSAGDMTRISLLNSYKPKFLGLGIGSAEFSLAEDIPSTAAFVLIDNSMGYKIFMAIMAEFSNPHRHFLRQMLEIFAGNISLALALKAKFVRRSLDELLAANLQKMKHFGVEAMAAWAKRESARAFWITAQGARPFGDARQLIKIIGEDRGDFKGKKKEEICAVLPSAEPFNTISLNDFIIEKETITVLFAGRFGDSNVVFSKLRDLLSDLGEYEPDRDVIQAFRRLKEDHKLIVKGEKIASILETAVAVNHEINNPLTAILGNTQLLAMRAEKLPKDVAAKIKAIEQSAMRIRQVTQKLLAVVEPITTGYTENLEMLDIDKSSETRSADDS